LRPAVLGSATDRAVKKTFKLATSYRMLQLADRLGFDLADALARHFEDSAHLLERVGVAVAQAVPQFDDLALAHGPVEADRVPADLENPASFFNANAGGLGRLLD